MLSPGSIFPGSVSPRGKHAGAYNPRTYWGYWAVRIGLILLAAALVAWPLAEPFFLQTEYTTLTAADLPPSIGSLRIVYVSDIHFGGLYTAARLEGLIQRINAAEADLVLLGGDYATNSDSAVAFFTQLPTIRARYGVYAVMGNHDRTIPEDNLSRLTEAMRRAGIRPLVNAAEKVHIGAGTITLAGLDDVHNGHPDLRGVAAQVVASDYVIFLCHSPAVISDALAARDRNGQPGWFDLGLFGHTHGGQVAWLGTMLRDDGVPDEYTAGWFKRSRIDLLVSRGVGTSGLPVRWLCRPQMHVVTVKSISQ